MERLSMEEIKVLKDTIGFRVGKIKADGSFEAKRNIFCVVKEDIQDTPLNRVNTGNKSFLKERKTLP